MREVLGDVAAGISHGYVVLDNLVRPVATAIADAFKPVTAAVPVIDIPDLGCGLLAGVAVANGAACFSNPSLQGTPYVAPNGAVVPTNACVMTAICGGYFVKTCTKFGGDSDMVLRVLNDPRAASNLSDPGVRSQAAASAGDIRTALSAGKPIDEILAQGQHPSFWKPGDNGTASCSAYCHGSNWIGIGSTGICVEAIRHDTTPPAHVACDFTPNLLANGAELSCRCIQAELKPLNNSTVSCDDFCEKPQWAGWTGLCVDGWDTAGTPPRSIGCQAVLGNDGNPHNVTCSCIRAPTG